MKIGDIVIVRGSERGKIVGVHAGLRASFVTPFDTEGNMYAGTWVEDEYLEPVNCSIGKVYDRYYTCPDGVLWDAYCSVRVIINE